MRHAKIVSRLNGWGNSWSGIYVEEEDPNKGALPSWPRGQKGTKADLKRDASALALSETLKRFMVEKEDALAKRGDK
jgi:hypothetical protein